MQTSCIHSHNSQSVIATNLIHNTNNACTHIYFWIFLEVAYINLAVVVLHCFFPSQVCFRYTLNLSVRPYSCNDMHSSLTLKCVIVYICMYACWCVLVNDTCKNTLRSFCVHYNRTEDETARPRTRGEISKFLAHRN